MADIPDRTRRSLLVGLPLVPTAMALDPAPAAASGAPQSDRPADPRQPQFETTDHVARFYRLARR